MENYENMEMNEEMEMNPEMMDDCPYEDAIGIDLVGAIKTGLKIAGGVAAGYVIARKVTKHEEDDKPKKESWLAKKKSDYEDQKAMNAALKELKKAFIENWKKSKSEEPDSEEPESEEE